MEAIIYAVHVMTIPFIPHKFGGAPPHSVSFKVDHKKNVPHTDNAV